jgi:hypothetical protein
MPFCNVEPKLPLLEAPKQVQLQYIQDKYFLLCKPSTGKSSPHQLRGTLSFSNTMWMGKDLCVMTVGFSCGDLMSTFGAMLVACEKW